MTQILPLSPRGSHLVGETQERADSGQGVFQDGEMTTGLWEPRTRVSPSRVSGHKAWDWAGQAKEAVLTPEEQPQGEPGRLW